MKTEGDDDEIRPRRERGAQAEAEPRSANKNAWIDGRLARRGTVRGRDGGRLGGDAAVEGGE